MSAASTRHARPAPEGIDPTTPNAARIHDYLLGGKDNYTADRAVAKHMLALAPESRTVAWFRRKFLTHAATLAAEAGVRQFIDIGAGIPTTPTVHDALTTITPDVRVAYVDYDPLVYAHANALYAGVPGVTPMLADFRDPDHTLLARIRTEAGIDFDQPVALLLVGVLDYILDSENPAECISRFAHVMAPGSYIAFTHAAAHSDDTLIQQLHCDTDGSTAQCVFRTEGEINALVDGFELLEPGIVPVQDWLADDLPASRWVILSGIGRT